MQSKFLLLLFQVDHLGLMINFWAPNVFQLFLLTILKELLYRQSAENFPRTIWGKVQEGNVHDLVFTWTMSLTFPICRVVSTFPKGPHPLKADGWADRTFQNIQKEKIQMC
ncbi:uncharacterized protein LOC144382356 isoform X2 [Halichoerus grypus]